MIGYPYIQQLFQTVLNRSLVIGGNFYVCPKWGSELSNPDITEALPIGATSIAGKTKYPAALLMPPPKEGNFEYVGNSRSSGTSLYDIYDIRMLFVGNAVNTGENQPSTPNAIGTSQHTIPMMWHDMDRVAQNFLSVLQTILASLGGNVIIWDAVVPRIKLITDLGSDQVSGVMLMFKLAMFSGCAIEDYAAGWQTAIVAPALVDSHPLHEDL